MAARYWVGGASTWDATAGTKWSLTTGGAGGQAVPTSSDDVYLDNGTGTGNVTISAAATALTLTCTGYTGVLRFTQNLTVSGSVTFAATQATMTADLTTRYLRIGTAGASLTSGGTTLPCSLMLGASTPTFVDDWTCLGSLQTDSANVTMSAVGRIISANGLKLDAASLSGTGTVRLTGGTWSTSGAYACAVSLNFDGNSTISGTVISTGTGTFTWTSGTITTTASQLNIAGTVTFNTAGMTWNIIKIAGAGCVINSLLSATTLQLDNPTGVPAFTGTAGFTVGTLTNPTTLSSNKAIAFTHTNTYTITGTFTLAGNAAGPYYWTLKSDHATLKVPFTFSGSTQSVDYTNTGVNAPAAGLDSSGGSTIHCPNGTFYLTLNWDNAGGGASGAMWLFS
jgi:hypothetical protein